MADKDVIALCLKKKFECKCSYCGVDLTFGEKCSTKATIDHIIPKCQGGTDDIDNLTPSCLGCNNRKQMKLPHEWMSEVGFYELFFPNGFYRKKEVLYYLKNPELIKRWDYDKDSYLKYGFSEESYEEWFKGRQVWLREMWDEMFVEDEPIPETKRKKKQQERDD